jgi:hypothetical protein
MNHDNQTQRLITVMVLDDQENAIIKNHCNSTTNPFS